MSVEAQEVLVRKENWVLLVALGIKERMALQALKETQDRLGLLVPKVNRVFKDSQVFQDHQVLLVRPANLAEKVFLDSKEKKVMTVPQVPRVHLGHLAHLDLQG